MNTQQLEYFIAVSETLNFTKAAQNCFISQTAMSLQIQALEKNLGFLLFDRDKHHVRLTPAGRVYLKKVKAIVDELSEARKLGKIASEGVAGNLTIGFIRGYEHSDISTSLRAFHESTPNISIHFIRNNMSRLYEQLSSGDCDIAYTLFPYYGKMSDDLHAHFMKKMPLYICLYPGHPLADKKACMYSELNGEEFIIMQPKGRPAEETEEVLLCHERGGFIPNIVRWESEIQTILISISIGLGVAIIPEYAVIFYKNAPNLRFIPLVTAEGDPETLDFGACWKKEIENPVLQTFIAQIK